MLWPNPNEYGESNYQKITGKKSHFGLEHQKKAIIFEYIKK
jgi:hypothetical protein